MSETKRSHFVPKSYLKQFGFPRKFGTDFENDLSVWTQRVDIPKFSPKIIEVGNGLCIEDYFYKFDSSNSIVDPFYRQNPNYIEDFGFPYENQLPKLLNLLCQNSRFSPIIISKKDSESISFALIDIKWRNPNMRQFYYLNDSLKTLDEAKNFAINFAKENSLDITKILFDLEDKKEIMKFVHTSAPYRDGLIANLRSDMLALLNSSKWLIIQTDVNNQIITSDNPGIFLNISEVWSFVTVKSIAKFKIDRLFFPLSPLYGLLILLSQPDNISTLFEKRIELIYSPQSILLYNSAHCGQANKILIASNKQALKVAWEKGKDSWINKKSF